MMNSCHFVKPSFDLRLYIEGSINSARISLKVGWCKLKPVLKAPAYSA
jgi:hypothetical protein